MTVHWNRKAISVSAVQYVKTFGAQNISWNVTVYWQGCSAVWFYWRRELPTTPDFFSASKLGKKTGPLLV
jgi:hypothetical protein